MIKLFCFFQSKTSTLQSTIAVGNPTGPTTTPDNDIEHIDTLEDEKVFRQRCEGFVAPYAVEKMIGMYKAQRDKIPGLKTFNQVQWVSKRYDSQDIESKDFMFMLGAVHLEAFEDDDDPGLKSCDPVSRYARWIVKTEKIDKPLKDMINFANEFQAKPEMSAGDLAAIDEFWRKEANMEKGQNVRKILDECGKLKDDEDGKEKKGDANSEKSNVQEQNNDKNDKGGDADKKVHSDSESKKGESEQKSPGGRRSMRLGLKSN